MDNIINIFNQITENSNKNANELWQLYGDTETYKTLRIRQYRKATHLLLNGYKYKIINLYTSQKERTLVECKRLGLRPKRKWFSGKFEKRRVVFAIASNFDKEAILYKLIAKKNIELV